MYFIFLLVTLIFPSTLLAETVFATKTIRANSIISSNDIHVRNKTVSGAAVSLAQVVGMEAKVALYAGRPVDLSDLATPALVERNQIVSLRLNYGGLAISTTGRALDRGSAGEQIRVMNLASRSSLFGSVDLDGSVIVNIR